MRFGRCATLAIITGEEQAFEWARNRPSGLDLAAEGIVVVTIQSRTNIFGWLTTGDTDAPGNLALHDQRLALHWIHSNVQQFGGAASQVTLLGHGTSGAANAMLHLASPLSAVYFARLILMSGTVLSPWSFQVTRNAASTSLAVLRNLACDAPSTESMLQCVRQKSVVDLLRAFENVHQNGNYTRLLGAEVERYLPVPERWLARDPRAVLAEGAGGVVASMPIMVGLCSNEGAFVREHWLELAREGYAALWRYVQETLVPNALEMYGFRGKPPLAIDSVRATINWRFFEQAPRGSVPDLLAAMQRFVSEVRFERPFFETVEMLAAVKAKKRRRSGDDGVDASALVSDIAEDDGIMEHRSAPQFDDSDNGFDDEIDNENARFTDDDLKSPSSLYVYSFQQPGTIDLRGRPNYFGGAAHTADLLFLMGPSLYQQIGRRKLTITEEKLCKRMRQTFADFVKTGNPTPGRLFDAWHPYTVSHRYVQVLGGSAANAGTSTAATMMLSADANALLQNREQIVELLSSPGGKSNNGDEVTVTSTNLALNPYAIGQRKIDAINSNSFDDNQRHAKSGYLPDDACTDSPYTTAMGRVSTFWGALLPRMYQQQMQLQRSANGRNPHDNPDAVAVAAAGDLAAKFRHAFFSMLALVCVLLAMLGICVYILRKGHRGRRHINTSYL